MNITNNQQIQSNQSFKAIKMVKCSMEEYNKIMQAYGKFFQEGPYIVFKNRSINDCDTFNRINSTAAALDKSTNWLWLNCKLNGIKLPDLETAPFFEISGKDVLKTIGYRIKGLFKSIGYGVRNAGEIQAAPEHLQQIKLSNSFADYDYPKFLKFLKKNNAEELNFDKYMEELAQRFGI